MMGDTAEHGEFVVEHIPELMAVGLRVYDANAEKIGTVRRYDLDAGYMVVEEGLLAKRELYLPFHLIASIDPREMYLTIVKSALTDAYLLPPAARPRIDAQVNPDTGQSEEMITHEIVSGYDGHPVQIEPVPLDELERTLAVGMTVLDVDGDYVGEVTQYDAARRLLAVTDTLNEGTISFVALSDVAHVDPDDMSVALLVPKIALGRDRTM